MKELRDLGYLPFVIGGGHEVSYGHFKGLENSGLDTSLQIVNFDAHFDLRPLSDDGLGSSGTPFKQIHDDLKSKGVEFNYSCYGIQKNSNHGGLFETAQKLNVNFIEAIEFELDRQKVIESVKKDIEKKDYIYMTICLDVFADYSAPGVSAPSPLVILHQKALELIKLYAESGKLSSFDIAELSPRFDKDEKTAKLAASIFAETLNFLKL